MLTCQLSPIHMKALSPNQCSLFLNAWWWTSAPPRVQKVIIFIKTNMDKSYSVSLQIRRLSEKTNAKHHFFAPSMFPHGKSSAALKKPACTQNMARPLSDDAGRVSAHWMEPRGKGLVACHRHVRPGSDAGTGHQRSRCQDDRREYK